MAEGTVVTNTNSELPAWAGPYMGDMLGRSLALSYTPYQAYPGQRLADFTPQQQQAFGMVQNMADQGLPWQTTAGSDLADQAGIAVLSTGQWTNPGVSQSYMSPYMQNVVNVQKAEAIRDYGRQLPGEQAAATRAGAFGGLRQAIVQAEGQRNLQNQLANIQATGGQKAFEAAQQAMAKLPWQI